MCRCSKHPCPLSQVSASCHRRRSGVRSQKEISDVFSEGWLMVFGNQDIVSFQTLDLDTKFPLGMHRVQAENTPFHGLGGQEGLEFTALIVLFLHIAMPQNPSCADFITTELMDWVGRFVRCPQRFPINGQMSMIGFSLWRLQSAGFVSTAALSFPPCEESGQDAIKVSAIDQSEHVAIGHLTRHRASRQSEALHESHPTMTDPVSGPAERSFVLPLWPG